MVDSTFSTTIPVGSICAEIPLLDDLKRFLPSSIDLKIECLKCCSGPIVSPNQPSSEILIIKLVSLLELCIKLGNLKIVQDGKLHQNYSEELAFKYMKNDNIEISVEVYTGKKDFTAYTMDLTNKYIDINADYRS